MQLSVAINTLEKILKYLEPLLPFANAHMVDFFTKNLYEKYIPSEIRLEIDKITVNNILEVFWNENSDCKELNTFITDCRNYTLPKTPEVCFDLGKLELKLKNLGCPDLSGLQMRTFMSFKKSHEVEIMSKIASAVHKIANTSHIVDIGDGKGYLSSALTMHSKIKVLGIDASPVNTVGAAKRVATMARVLKRSENQKVESKFYKQTTKFITETTNLNEIVQENFPESEVINKLGLVGLHTCGDLAPSSLRIFHCNENVKTICNVGCCYHLLSEKKDGDNFGFPMSKYLISKNFVLGRNARMIAAQSLDRMIYEKEPPSEVLFYRSLLQILLIKYFPHLSDCQVGRFKKSTTFNQYVKKALVKLKCENIPDDEIIAKIYENYLPKLKELQVFYMLRAHLAPVIEAVILLDRLIYLIELGYVNSYLVKVFDSVISPRCYGIITLK